MTDPAILLFEKLYEGSPLFKNQLDLAQRLLEHPQSNYLIKDKGGEEYARAISRLKAYISQLLSSNAVRNITEDFRNSLLLVITERLKNLNYSPKEVTTEIISRLKDKNRSIDKIESKKNVYDQVYSDLGLGKYIAVITSRPLEISKDIESKSFSFQRFFVNDLFSSFNEPHRNLKCYRFNFPLQQFGQVFWKELKKVFREYIKSSQHKSSLYEGLYSNYFISSEILKPLGSETTISNEELENIVDCILEYLNRNRYLLVFIVQEPIYTMPLIAIDPDDPLNAKIYAVFDNGSGLLSIHKYTKEDYLLWRIFTWDKLKTTNLSASLKFEKRLFE